MAALGPSFPQRHGFPATAPPQTDSIHADTKRPCRQRCVQSRFFSCRTGLLNTNRVMSTNVRKEGLPEGLSPQGSGLRPGTRLLQRSGTHMGSSGEQPGTAAGQRAPGALAAGGLEWGGAACCTGIQPIAEGDGGAPAQAASTSLRP